MARERKLTVPLVVRMTPEMLAALKARAAEEERTVAGTIRKAVRDALTDRVVGGDRNGDTP